jgi:predicted dehydrogenase
VRAASPSSPRDGSYGLHHFLTAIRAGADVTPHGADFEDGNCAAEVCDAIVRSGHSGSRETVTYRAGSAAVPAR